MTPTLALLFSIQDEDKAHHKVYERILPSVVAVRATATFGERSGTGIVLDADGLILTSYSIVPEGAEEIRVFFYGPKMLRAQIVATSERDEITLLRVKPDRKLTPAPLGESSRVKIGSMSYTIGNAANSFIIDDQPAFNMGIVSGFYNLRETRQHAKYVGYVFETTAAVNWGMEGAPLLNSEGQVVGVTTLNYSPSRWLGNAIPIDTLRPRIRQMLATSTSEPSIAPAIDLSEGTLGLTVKVDEKKELVADRVDAGGPADLKGIAPGDVIEAVGGKPVKTAEDFAAVVRSLKAGALVPVRVRALGAVQELRLFVAPRSK